MKNNLILTYLKKLGEIARSHSEVYRERAFRRAERVIKSLNFTIKNADQLKGIRGIGKGIHDRIQEIIKTKKLKEVDNYHIINKHSATTKEDIIETFSKIHGVGRLTAEKWYKQGYKSIDDLVKLASLTHAQEIGIEYYDEINSILQNVANELKQLNSKIKIKQNLKQNSNQNQNKEDFICIIAGSYRRGLPYSHDIDCLVYSPISNTNPYPNKRIEMFINKLIDIGLITDTLSYGESKYTGICIDNKGIHRRIDFEFVEDKTTFPYELLYFTGSQQLNLDMRSRAKELNMILNQRGLFTKKGKLIKVNSEKEIFEQLGMNYLAPNMR